MEKTAELTGVCAAAALLVVSEKGPLIPAFTAEQPDGSRNSITIVERSLEQSVARGQEWLRTNEFQSARAVLACDAFITLEAGKTDALIIEARQYAPSPSSFKIAIPYRPAASREGFAIFRAKVLPTDDPSPDYPMLLGAFMRGLRQDPRAAELWASRMDRSR